MILNNDLIPLKARLIGPPSINLSPRKVVQWRKTGRVEFENVVPTPFGPERAKEIYSKRGFMLGNIADTITPGEDAYVLAVWDTIKSGSSSWMTAFYEILNNRFTIQTTL